MSVAENAGKCAAAGDWTCLHKGKALKLQTRVRVFSENIYQVAEGSVKYVLGGIRIF